MAKGIYERTGKNGDVTYYIRYQFKTVGADGVEFIKDLKEKVGRKSRGFTRELAREALKAREGEIAQGRFNLQNVKKPHAIGELLERKRKKPPLWPRTWHKSGTFSFSEADADCP
jgi:hypothetical protein